MGYKCVVECDRCHQAKIEWRKTMAYTNAREFARSRFWVVGEKIGWICPECAGKEVAK